jgi:hypothetical protein
MSQELISTDLEKGYRMALDWQILSMPAWIVIAGF